RHLDAFTRRSNHWEVGAEGRSVTSVAAEFGIAHSIVSPDFGDNFKTSGTAIRGFSSVVVHERNRRTGRGNRCIVLQAS
ncbi:hypothetical protein TNCV_4277051, partial [Trichonephila clavipes]